MSGSHQAMAILRRLCAVPLAVPLLMLMALLAVSVVNDGAFVVVRWQNGHLSGSLIDICNRAAPLMLTALGMSMVIVVRGLDVSVGAVAAISATVAAFMIGGQFGAAGAVAEHSLGLALSCALGAALLCGLWNGLLVAGVGMQPIVATLMLMVAGRGIAQLLSDGQILTVYYPPFFWLGNGHVLGMPFAFLLVLAVGLGLQLVLSRTALGLFLRAVGSNPLAAHIAGVRTKAILLAAYALCALTAGSAGLIMSSNIKSADANHLGEQLELDGILAVALGGSALTGGQINLPGALLGALIIQTLTTMIYSLGVPPQVNLLVKAGGVFAVLLLQSAAWRARPGSDVTPVSTVPPA